MDNTPKLLHTWDITLTKTVEETAPENVNGQLLPVTRKVEKPVVTKMALKQPTRRELRAAELFHAKRKSWYIQQGFIPYVVMHNKLTNMTGGILSDQQKERRAHLQERAQTLDKEVNLCVNEPERKDKLQKELSNVKSELLQLHSISESVFNDTAERRAERDLTDWFAFHMTMIERGGQWVTYFEGQGATPEETFALREEHMWKLEESGDEFYKAAATKISTSVYLFNMGLSTPEQFKLADEELSRELAKEKAKEPAAPVAVTPDANSADQAAAV